jgi:hypothetical protein
MYKHDFFLVEAKGINLENAKKIINWMGNWNVKFQFIGPDDHLNSLKSEYPEKTFFGNRCSGEQAPVLAASKALISFNVEDFPALALATLATGRPVVLISDLSKWLSGSGIFFVNDFSEESFKKIIGIIPNDDIIEEKKLRAHVMEYHDIKFKAQFKRTIDKAFHEKHSKDMSHSNDCRECN